MVPPWFLEAELAFIECAPFGRTPLWKCLENFPHICFMNCEFFFYILFELHLLGNSETLRILIIPFSFSHFWLRSTKVSEMFWGITQILKIEVLPFKYEVIGIYLEIEMLVI